LGYIPVLKQRQDEILALKRSQYRDLAKQIFDVDPESRDPHEKQIFKSIEDDVPRINSSIPLLQLPKVQNFFLRLLYIWAIRHPASGYVQGFTDLVLPFLSVFLFPLFGKDIHKIPNPLEDSIPDQLLFEIEADSYWCLQLFLRGVQDHYTYAQPGIQRVLYQLSAMITRLNEPMAEHIKKQDIDYIQFSFQWTNCFFC